MKISVFGLAIVCLAGCFVPLPVPHAVSDQILGGPCSVDSDCQSGLTCQVFERDPGGNIWEGGTVCSLVCDGGPSCPGTSVCRPQLSPNGTAAPENLDMCVPSCSSDSDCQTGNRAQLCIPHDGGPSVCEPLLCGRGNCGDPILAMHEFPKCQKDCPSGFQCVGVKEGYGFCQRH